VNIFLFISIVLLFTFIVGRWLQKIHVPWIFAALLFGTGLIFYNPLQEGITGSESFSFLAQLSMYFLLFIVGFEIKSYSVIIASSVLFTMLIPIIFSRLLYSWREIIKTRK